MKRIVLFLVITILSAFFNTKVAQAIENPLVSPNNSFGIHILDENDLTDASNLVNSSGGDWGYVTLVIRSDERDTKRWQQVFDQMRRLHLIPLVRLATKQQNDGWEKPSFDEIDGWVSFLTELNWVVKNRYVAIANEPNHAREWGGEVRPKEYADYFYTFAKRLKEADPDFFILNAGLDASAPNLNNHMDSAKFVSEMLIAQPNLFDYVDGWNSHSYPNPGFSGSVDDTGRGSVRTYDWELNYLKSLGVEKNLPVFITETGWTHNSEETKKLKNVKTEGLITKNYSTAFTKVWNDPRIVAVTPFILNYQGKPFEEFSWKKSDGTFWDFYYEVQKLGKTAGRQTQRNEAEFAAVFLPQVIERKGREWGIALVKNTGQAIWTNEKIESVNLIENVWFLPGVIKLQIEPISSVSGTKPFEKTLVFYSQD